MPTYYVRANDRHETRRYRAVKGDAITVTVDFSAWAEDFGTLTSAAWEVSSGNAAISGDALSSEVATALLTTADAGLSLIEVKGAGATNSKTFVLEVVTVDPAAPPVAYDYWWNR